MAVFQNTVLLLYFFGVITALLALNDNGTANDIVNGTASGTNNGTANSTANALDNNGTANGADNGTANGTDNSISKGTVNATVSDEDRYIDFDVNADIPWTTLINPEETDPDGDILSEPVGRFGTVIRFKRWPNGVVPYVISQSFSNQYREIIMAAINKFHKLSCVRFVPRTAERDYLYIEDRIGCKSLIGRYGGRQQLLLLAPKCFIKGKGTVIHELMHTLGFEHEHNRPDRNKYIRLNYTNLPKGSSTPDFLQINQQLVEDFGLPYDFYSIMHYSVYGNTINEQPVFTIINPYDDPKPPLEKIVGQRRRFSEIDLIKLNTMYNCSL